MATLVGFQMLQEPPSGLQNRGEEGPPFSTPGPFKATQIWNGIVDHLRTAVDVRTRKHLMRSYEDCFLGSDAVDVVCDFLEKANSDVKDVTREKIAKLCQYFLDQNIIEDALACNSTGSKRSLFMDSNSHYYRFSTNESKELPSSSSSSSSEHRLREANDSEDSSSSNNSTSWKRRCSIDALQQPFDRKRRLRNSLGMGRSARFDHRASMAEGRSANLKGIHNPAFEGPHSDSLTALVSPSRRPLSAINRRDTTPALQRGAPGRESRRERALSKQATSDVWREVIIQRILHLVELPHLDNLLACAWDYSYESAEHLERRMPNLSTPGRRQSSRRNGNRPDINSIDPWLRTALHCLEVHPEGAAARKDLCASRAHATTTGMLHARKLLLYQTLVSVYAGEKTSKDRPLLPALLTDIVIMILGALGGGKSSRAVELTQLCVLLLPALARVQLRALLRFMGEAGKKTAIKLAYQVDNRTHVCNALHSAIVSGPLVSAVQAKNLVSFFVDTQNRIFRVPEAVLEAVTARLALARQGETDLCKVVFCESVSPQEFDRQTSEVTKQAIGDLMNAIIDDTKIPLKEKKQRLKQLQKAHPDLYDQHFAGML